MTTVSDARVKDLTAAVEARQKELAAANKRRDELEAEAKKNSEVGTARIASELYDVARRNCSSWADCRGRLARWRRPARRRNSSSRTPRPRCCICTAHHTLMPLQLTASEHHASELDSKLAAVSAEFERSVARNKKMEGDLAELAELKKACCCSELHPFTLPTDGRGQQSRDQSLCERECRSCRRQQDRNRAHRSRQG